MLMELLGELDANTLATEEAHLSEPFLDLMAKQINK